DADAAYQKALDIEIKAHGEDSWQAAESMVDRSRVLNDVGHYDESIALLQRSLPILERDIGPLHPEVALAEQSLGNAYLLKGDHDQAKSHLLRSLAIKRARYPNGSNSLAFTLQSLGLVAEESGDLPGAEKYLQEAIDMRTRVLGPDHPDTLSSVYSLG